MKKNTLIAAASIILLSTAGIISCADGSSKDHTDDKSLKFTTEQVEHGGYLVTVSGCDDCHSPKNFGPRGPEIDSTRRLSGRIAGAPLPPVDTAALKSWALFAHDLTAAVGPWGVSFSANITSDPTGIGNWSFDQFKLAMQKGKYKGLENGRDLLPPMPWPNFSKFKEDDLRDIFAFLKSTKPVSNVVPAAIPPTQLK